MQNGVDTNGNLLPSCSRQATAELSGHSLSTAHSAARRTLRKTFLQHLHNNELILSTNTAAMSDDKQFSTVK